MEEEDAWRWRDEPDHLRSRLVTINSGAGSITADGRRDAGFRAGESEPTSITSSASDAMAQVIAASGVKVLAVGAFNVSLVGMVVDRDQYEESNRNRQQTVSTIVENPSVVWDAIKQPYVEDHSNHRIAHSSTASTHGSKCSPANGCPSM